MLALARRCEDAESRYDRLIHCCRFPGSPAAYNTLFDCADANLLADCQIFLATHPGAQNTAYNVNNGDVFRFSEARALRNVQTRMANVYLGRWSNSS